MINSWISSFFSWPNGGVWSNLLASVIWTVPALGFHHRKIKQHISDALAQQQGAVAEAKEPADADRV